MRVQVKTNFILFFGLILIIILINATGFDEGVKNFFYTLSSPIQKALWNTGETSASFFEEIFKESELRKELQDLRGKNQELLGELISLSQIKEENERLRIALDLGLQEEFSLILAEVVSKDISQDAILIDKGLRDGVLEKSPVITEQKVLLGKIGKVMSDFSEVVLISNKESFFDGEILDKEIKGIVKGRGSSQVSLDLVPKEDNLALEDLVMTSSLGAVFPSGFLVGTVREVRNSEKESFNIADLKPAFDLNSLKAVFIISNFND